MSTNELLEERGKTHGDFTENARLAQQFESIARTGVNYHKMEYIHKEALHMIFHKVARILSGDHTFDDAWDDLAGYAQLPKKFNHGREE